MSDTPAKPRIAAIPGDPNGIGPELLVKLLDLAEVSDQAEVLVVADRAVLAKGEADAGGRLRLAPWSPRDNAWPDNGAHAYLETQTIAPDALTPAQATEAGGRCALRTLDRALDLAREGVVDGVLFTPFNKAALHAAGLGHEDELHYIADYLDYAGHCGELNVMGDLWTSRVTSHVALKDVAALIDGPAIGRAIDLVDGTLRASGLARPRIAVAALNPHAGDQGNFGREEIDVIAPAVAAARARAIDASGPWPADTVFLKAKAGAVDAVVTMYHDQGQIAMKLMGFERGVTVQGGLPVAVTTPAHGTAFDIVGRGGANVEATRQAFLLLCRLATGRRRATS